jgi:hypothetical protein
MARARLKQDGVLCLTFASAHDKIGGKLFKMLTMAFDGKEPVVYDSGLSGYTFCSTDSPTSLTAADNGLRVMGDTVRTAQEGVEPSTDDWPFFYMMNREYPTSYLIMMVMLTFFSFAFCRRMAPGIAAGISLPCFFLGAGFMLVETKAITELALVFGSTWIVVSIVIAAILAMAYFSNCLVARGAALPDSLVYSLIVGTLVIGYFLPHTRLLSSAGALSDIAAVTFLTIPIFLAGLVFSKELKSAGVDRALSSNLMGAMLGGFLEYNSLYFGYQALYLLAALLYALAYFGRFRAAR